MDYTERFGGGSDDNEGLCVGLQICCPKLVCLEYAGHMANAFSFENLDSLKKAVIYPDAMAHRGLTYESFGDSICQLFAGVSHVESLSLNLFFIQAITAGVLSAISDIVSQKLSGIQKLQIRRLLLKVLFGFSYLGPFGHYYHILLG
ncbi:hypothetical protein HanPSC8_Chr17g0754481 [Helianthus annuus]|nr:hypothetical protein HanPSC8_Chr17g0754481 [Helianthus annuus]